MFSLCDFPGDRKNNLNALRAFFAVYLYHHLVLKRQSELERVSWLKFRYSHLQRLPIEKLSNLIGDPVACHPCGCAAKREIVSRQSKDVNL
jgi:hypothetical protein